MTLGKWTNDQSTENGCGPQWYGWSSATKAGSISTTLYRNDEKNCGRLNFGNCWTSGTVKVFLNGKLIGEANANTPSTVIEFAILVDSELEIREEGPDAVIKVTDFEMVDCATTTTAKEGKVFVKNLILEKVKKESKIVNF